MAFDELLDLKDGPLTLPSALISDGGVLWVPLYAVTTMTLTEAYKLPPIGSSGARAVVDTHDDTVSLTGLLTGDLRFAHKPLLETAAETGRRGGGQALYTAYNIDGTLRVASLSVPGHQLQCHAKRHCRQGTAHLAPGYA